MIINDFWLRFFVQNEQTPVVPDSIPLLSRLKDFDLRTHSWEDVLHSLLNEFFHFGVKLAICIAIWWVGKKLIKYLNVLLEKIMHSKKVDQSAVSFIKSLVNVLLTITLLVAIVNILGVNNTSLVALIASLGVAFGMALSGTLQNFSGGIMILLFKPYEIGDYIEAQGQGGTVKDIQIFNTIIVTSDNKTVFIPNGNLSTNVIVNFNDQKTRRVEWTVSINYGESFDEAKDVVKKILNEEKRILTTPVPIITIHNLSASSVDVLIRAWVVRQDYWDVYWAINEQVYKTFAEAGIDIPFNQLTVHIANNETPQSDKK